MNKQIEYWSPGKEFDAAIDGLFDERRLRNHLSDCIRHYLELNPDAPIPNEIILPESTFIERKKKFFFDINHDEVHLIEYEYLSNRITGSWIEILVAIGTVRQDDTTGYSVEKFLAKLRYNAIYNELIAGPYDYDLFFSFPNLHEELQNWDDG